MTDRHPDAVLVRRAALRTGLLAALGAAVIVLVLATGAVLVLLRSQQTEAAALLAAAVKEADDVDDPPAGMWLVIRNAHGTQVTAGTPAGVPVEAAMAQVRRTGALDLRDVTVPGHRFRVRTQPEPIGLVQGALDLDTDRLETYSVLRALLLIGGVGLLLAAVGGAWVGRRAARPLAEALSLQRRFVADASHELRTPVTLLSTRAQLLRRGIDTAAPARTRGELDGLVADAERLAEVLDDLLVTADQRYVEPVAVELTGLAREVAARAPDGPVRVRAPGADVVPVFVDGSPVALRRALTALVDNAVRYAASEVTIEVRGYGRDVALDVSDDGPGIDPEMAPRLFDRFVSSDTRRPPSRPGGPPEVGPSDGEPSDGTAPDRVPSGGEVSGGEASGRAVPDRTRRYGLGLALVSEIAAWHHGTITSVGGPGRGATLRLTLPPARAGRSGSAPARAPGGG